LDALVHVDIGAPDELVDERKLVALLLGQRKEQLGHPIPSATRRSGVVVDRATTMLAPNTCALATPGDTPTTHGGGCGGRF